MRRAHERLIMGFAGTWALRTHLLLNGAADDQALADRLHQTSRHDARDADAILAHIHFDPPEEEQRFREGAQSEAEAFASEHWEEIVRVAVALAECRELDAEEVRGLLGGD